MSRGRALASALPELVAGVIALIVAGLFIVEARGLPPPFFEPIGSAAVPRATAWIVVVLSVAMMRRALLSGAPGSDGLHSPRDVQRTLAFALLILLYVAALGLTRIGYAWSTVAFLSIAIPLLGGFSRQWFLRSIGLGIVLGFGLQFVFTRILVTDLP